MTPFLSFYTPAYKRPAGLAACLASVATQTVVKDIEQIVICDHVGIGIDGMYRCVPQYEAALHGRYIAFLCDDDVLAGPDVVERVRTFAGEQGYPPLILVQAQKGGSVWPLGQPWPPVCGHIDLNCAIVRSDLWHRYAGAYGASYEGDFQFLDTLAKAGVYASYLPLLFSIGGVSHGRAEAA